jgi:hypothetical protein
MLKYASLLALQADYTNVFDNNSSVIELRSPPSNFSKLKKLFIVGDSSRYEKQCCKEYEAEIPIS